MIINVSEIRRAHKSDFSTETVVFDVNGSSIAVEVVADFLKDTALVRSVANHNLYATSACADVREAARKLSVHVPFIAAMELNGELVKTNYSEFVKLVEEFKNAIEFFNSELF